MIAVPKWPSHHHHLPFLFLLPSISLSVGPSLHDLGGGTGERSAARAAKSGKGGEVEAGKERAQGGEAGADDGHGGFDLRPHVTCDYGIWSGRQSGCYYMIEHSL